MRSQVGVGVVALVLGFALGWGVHRTAPSAGAARSSAPDPAADAPPHDVPMPRRDEPRVPAQASEPDLSPSATAARDAPPDCTSVVSDCSARIAFLRGQLRALEGDPVPWTGPSEQEQARHRLIDSLERVSPELAAAAELECTERPCIVAIRGFPPQAEQGLWDHLVEDGLITTGMASRRPDGTNIHAVTVDPAPHDLARPQLERAAYRMRLLLDELEHVSTAP